MKKSFKQSWGSNMSKAGEPKIKEFSGEEFTKITFYPDLSKFNMEKLDEDTIALLSRWDLLDMHFISLPFFPNLSLLHGLIHFIKYIFISLYLGEPTTLLRPRGESRSFSTASGCPSRTSRIMWISTSR